MIPRTTPFNLTNATVTLTANNLHRLHLGPEKLITVHEDTLLHLT